MVNTGATGPTSHAAVTTNGSFGQSLNTINGGFECSDTYTGHRTSTVTRLDKYCKAADELGVEVLSFGGCTDLQTVYDSCIFGGSGTWGTCTSCDAIASSPTTSE